MSHIGSWSWAFYQFPTQYEASLWTPYYSTESAFGILNNFIDPFIEPVMTSYSRYLLELYLIPSNDKTGS